MPLSPLQIIAFIAALLLFCWQVWRVIKNYRAKRQFTPSQQVGPEAIHRSQLSTRKRIWIAVVIVLVIFFAVIQTLGKYSQNQTAIQLDRALSKFFMIIAFVLFPLLIFLLLLLWMMRDRSVRRAEKLRSSGQFKEAEALLKETISRKGPTMERANHLGVVLLQQERLEEALEQFKLASTLATTRNASAAINNQVICLKQMGRNEEMLHLMKQAYSASPDDFATVANYCMVLVDAGQMDLAYEKLCEAESLYARYNADIVKSWLPILEECRMKAGKSKGFEVIMPGLSEKTEPENS